MRGGIRGEVEPPKNALSDGSNGSVSIPPSEINTSVVVGQVWFGGIVQRKIRDVKAIVVLRKHHNGIGWEKSGALHNQIFPLSSSYFAFR